MFEGKIFHSHSVYGEKKFTSATLRNSLLREGLYLIYICIYLHTLAQSMLSSLRFNTMYYYQNDLCCIITILFVIGFVMFGNLIFYDKINFCNGNDTIKETMDNSSLLSIKELDDVK